MTTNDITTNIYQRKAIRKLNRTYFLIGLATGILLTASFIAGVFNI